MTRIGNVKVKSIKCTRCSQRCDPYQDSVEGIADNCMKKNSCGLLHLPHFDKLPVSREIVVVPFMKRKETLHLPDLPEQKALPAILDKDHQGNKMLEALVEECCDTHKSHRPIPQDGEVIKEFSVPLVISLKGERVKKSKRKHR